MEKERCEATTKTGINCQRENCGQAVVKRRMREAREEAPVGQTVSLSLWGEDKETGGVLFSLRSPTAGNSLAISVLQKNACVCVHGRTRVHVCAACLRASSIGNCLSDFKQKFSIFDKNYLLKDDIWLSFRDYFIKLNQVCTNFVYIAFVSCVWKSVGALFKHLKDLDLCI